MSDEVTGPGLRSRPRPGRRRAWILGTSLGAHAAVLVAASGIVWTVERLRAPAILVRVRSVEVPEAVRRPQPAPVPMPAARYAEPVRTAAAARETVTRRSAAPQRLAVRPAAARVSQHGERREVVLRAATADADTLPLWPPVTEPAEAPGVARDAEPRPLPGCRPPDYPPRARELGLTGVAVLQVSLDATGRVLEVAVAESSGSRLLDRTALEAVRGWRFRPRMRDGRAVPCTVRQPVRFALR